MVTDRIIGAFTFRKGVYAEVERDTSFTTTAWFLVAVVAFLNQLGSHVSGGAANWFLSTIGGTVFAILGFVLAALVINWVGRGVFGAEVDFDELVRTLGLAYVWQVIGILGIVTGTSDALSCVVQIFGGLVMIVAWLIAAREALDLEWGQTLITVILGWLAQFVTTIIIGALVLGLLELGGSAMGALFGS